MIWLTLRQHRVQIAGMLAIALLLAITLVLAAEYAARVRAELGVDTCVPFPNTDSNCANLNTEWGQRVSALNYIFYSLYVLPGLVASYVGGPLFAIEFERGTHRLAWTQGISRVRWAAVKLVVVLGVSLAAGSVLAPFGGRQSVFFTQFGNVPSPFDTFEIQGLALVSYFVFGIAAGAFVGAWSRRLVTGMFVGLLVFGVVRVGVHNLRPMYQEPATASFPAGHPFAAAIEVPRDAWRLGVRGFDLEGRSVPNERMSALEQEYFRGSGGISVRTSDTDFLLAHGVVRRFVYQPADRFWTFQAIEAAIFTGLAALFALLTLWRVRSRDA
jgi:ABC-type transport system involved in multi-copper enzyme maturation permease subunit